MTSREDDFRVESNGRAFYTNPRSVGAFSLGYRVMFMVRAFFKGLFNV